MNEEKNPAAKALKDLRRSLGLTQTELAELTGKKQPSIARVESGHGNAKISTLVDIAKALGKEVYIEIK